MFRNHTEDVDEISPSYLNYKIDYNRCLGSGVFGTVYEVTYRPENEKGFISAWVPYAYDYFFEASPADKEPRHYCVKMYKTSIRLLLENIDHPFHFRLPWQAMFESAKEEKTNRVLRKHNLSNIRFFKTSGFYSQFKTIVKGQTLHHHFMNGTFMHSDQFILRKAFVCFLRNISNPAFTFWDLNEHNLMYDEQAKRWEIIDGIFNEVTDTTLEMQGDNLNFFLIHLTKLSLDTGIKYWLVMLSAAARNHHEYTEEDDQLALQQYRMKTSDLPIPKSITMYPPSIDLRMKTKSMYEIKNLTSAVAGLLSAMDHSPRFVILAFIIHFILSEYEDLINKKQARQHQTIHRFTY